MVDHFKNCFHLNSQNMLHRIKIFENERDSVYTQHMLKNSNFQVMKEINSWWANPIFKNKGW